MHPLEQRDLFLGLTDLSLDDSPVDLGDGLVLSKTFAKFLSPLPLVNTAPPDPDPLKLSPAYWQCSARDNEVLAQLFIPATAVASFSKRYELGSFLVALLRLWSDPSIGLHVLSSHNFASLVGLPDTDRPVLIPIETHMRHFRLATIEPSSVVPSLPWVKDNWKTAYRLYVSSAEFRLAVDTLDSGQFVPNPALALVALWGALEAIFSPSTAELKFRVSALIASYLKPPGQERLELQKQMASLYDMRSAAAHGKPKHHGDDLLKTFELLRRVVIRMIHDGAVPTKDLLERRLFGAE